MENAANNIMMNVVPQEHSYSFFVVIVIGLLVLAGISVFVLQWKQEASPWGSGPFGAQEQPWYKSWWSTAPASDLGVGLAGNTMPDTTMPGAKKPGAKKSGATTPGAAATATATPEQSLKTHMKESWCFVGEDLTGRYCVKVPSEKSCDADRVFGNRKDCELTPANHMATGIVKENGESMLPLAKMRFG